MQSAPIGQSSGEIINLTQVKEMMIPRVNDPEEDAATLLRSPAKTHSLVFKGMQSTVPAEESFEQLVYSAEMIMGLDKSDSPAIALVRLLEQSGCNDFSIQARLRV